MESCMISGNSVSLSSDGTTVAIGAPYNDGFRNSSGHVRIFKLNDEKLWTQIGSDIDGEALGDYTDHPLVCQVMV